MKHDKIVQVDITFRPVEWYERNDLPDTATNLYGRAVSGKGRIKLSGNEFKQMRKAI